jgi:transposase-like protein
LIERGGELRAGKVNCVSANKLQGIIRQHVDTSANINTDEFRLYNGLDKTFAKHSTVHHGAGEYVNGTVHTNTLESWFSLLKRGVNGTFHHVSEKHLDRYINEFVFRYNNRKTDDVMRAVLAIEQTKGKRLTYRETKIEQ